MKMRVGVPILALPLLCGCNHQTYQSTFSDAAVEVRQFNNLFLIFLLVCGVMYLLVIGFLIAGIVRRRRGGPANVAEDGRHHESDPLMRAILIGWATLIGVGLVALAIASFFGDRSMARAASDPRLSITITANQWWWDVNYSSADNSRA